MLATENFNFIVRVNLKHFYSVVAPQGRKCKTKMSLLDMVKSIKYDLPFLIVCDQHTKTLIRLKRAGSFTEEKLKISSPLNISGLCLYSIIQYNILEHKNGQKNSFALQVMGYT